MYFSCYNDVDIDRYACSHKVRMYLRMSIISLNIDLSHFTPDPHVLSTYGWCITNYIAVLLCYVWIGHGWIASYTTSLGFCFALQEVDTLELSKILAFCSGEVYIYFRNPTQYTDIRSCSSFWPCQCHALLHD